MIRTVVALTASAFGASAFGQVTLNAAANVDNQFVAYVSTSPTVAGTGFLSGDTWGVTYTGTYVFPSGGTYYLHVMATDTGRPEMFLGTFSLSNDGGSTFGNGATTLLSNSTDWVVSNTGFGVATIAPLDLGGNGAGPWGFFPGQSPQARYVWAPEYTSTVYFTAVINVVPGPGAGGVLGLAGLALVRRRR